MVRISLCWDNTGDKIHYPVEYKHAIFAVNHQLFLQNVLKEIEQPTNDLKAQHMCVLERKIRKQVCCSTKF